MNKHNEIFESMHEKMTPGSEAEKRLFERAEAEACGKVIPSEENSGGITMNKTTNEMTHKTDTDTVHTRRGGFIAAAAAVAVVLGIGGYTLFTGTPDIDDASSPAAAVSQEDTASDISAAETTVTADTPDIDEKASPTTTLSKEDTDSDVSAAKTTVTAEMPENADVLTEEKALEKGCQLLGVPVSEVSVGENYLKCDFGVETYEFTVLCSNGVTATLTVPTGLKTETNEEFDAFMTETAAGQALADAGIAHDGFEAMCVIAHRDDESQEPSDDNGWSVLFTANGKVYNYFITELGNIADKSSYIIESSEEN